MFSIQVDFMKVLISLIAFLLLSATAALAFEDAAIVVGDWRSNISPIDKALGAALSEKANAIFTKRLNENSKAYSIQDREAQIASGQKNLPSARFILMPSVDITYFRLPDAPKALDQKSDTDPSNSKKNMDGQIAPPEAPKRQSRVVVYIKVVDPNSSEILAMVNEWTVSDGPFELPKADVVPTDAFDKSDIGVTMDKAISKAADSLKNMAKDSKSAMSRALASQKR